MRTIPAGITTLIKSRSLIGSDAPTGWVEFPDLSLDPIEKDDWLPANTRVFRRVDTDHNCFEGNWVTRADGKLLACWQEQQPSGNPKIYLSTVDDEDTIYSTNNAFATNQWVFMTRATANIENSPCRLLKRTDGKLLLFVVEAGTYDTGSGGQACYIEVYESANGLGTDFTKIGEVYRNSNAANYTGSIYGHQNLGIPLQLLNGRILISFCGQEDWISTYGRAVNCVAYSDDDGVTWTVKELYNYNYIIGSGSRTLCKFGSRLVAAATHAYGYGALKFYYSDDDGETWTGMTNWNEDALYWSAHWGGLADDQNYLLHTKDNSVLEMHLYKATSDTFPIADDTCYSYSAIGGAGFWQGAYDDTTDMGLLGSDALFINQDSGYLAILGWDGTGTNNGIILNGVRRDLSFYKLQVTNLSIQREEAADSQRMTFSFPNVNPNDPTDMGYFMPYRTTEFGKTQNSWYKVIIPSAKVRAKVGYGSNMAVVFTGEIDEVQFSADPRSYTVSVDCRDMACLLIDKQVSLTSGGETEYYIEYPLPADIGSTYWLTPGSITIPDIADIVKDLCMRAGFGATEVNIEATGIELDPMWEKMSFMDCINDLCTASGFEFWIDEDGHANFYHVSDREPYVENEYHSLSADFTLTHYPLISGSEVFSSEPDGGGTVFIKDTDYTIDYATGEVSPFGIVGDCYCAYIYAAHVYQEGEDLFGLNLTLSRRNLYGTIRVAGDGEEASATLTSPLWDGCRVDVEKVLFADNQYLDTVAKCQKCADRLKLDMSNRYVSTDFVAVAHPWLQVGDCIQVIESSTTISEIYKITAISFDLSPDGFSSNIASFHVGYAPIT